jgi:glycosyltransferase involved in cell wall biosynthesis
MACGVPVVAAERGGLPEVVGDAGELVDPESAEAIAGTIAALLVDPERRRALAARGRERAQRFRWEGSAQRTLEIYRAVLASPERRA